MKNITERHQFILEKLTKEGKVSIVDLVELMDVSGVTIRKDLKLLEDKKLLYRTHGGGSINNPYATENPVDEKEFINADEKKKIAKAAIELTEQTDSIMIGSGTTAYEFAKALHPTKSLTVITPSLKIGLELCNRPKVEVLQLGGLIRQNSSSVAGPYALRMLEGISCGIFFMGANGIDLEFGISISNLDETTLNQKMIETAQTIVVLADSTKFGRRGLGRVCGLEQIQYLVTDNKVSKNNIKALEDKGIKVLIA
jgi:DeoR family transcriptional regulator of aga operon